MLHSTPGLRALLILVVLVALGFAGYLAYLNPASVTELLNLQTPPRSLHVMSTERGIKGDQFIAYLVEIDPDRFPDLLQGYEFEEREPGETIPWGLNRSDRPSINRPRPELELE